MPNEFNQTNLSQKTLVLDFHWKQLVVNPRLVNGSLHCFSHPEIVYDRLKGKG